MQALHNICLLVFVGILVCTCQAQPDPPAPDTFVVLMNSTKGPVELAVTRFYALVKAGYYNQNAVFRVIAKFVAQWGIAADPAVSAKWANKNIANDPVVKSNLRGFVSFAAEVDGNVTCCRTTQLYINYANNTYLDAYGFSPFAFVQSGMQYVDEFYSGYGENPDQDQIYSQGNAYLKANFPLLDYFVSAELVKQ